jgi:hypothetical protein
MLNKTIDTNERMLNYMYTKKKYATDPANQDSTNLSYLFTEENRHAP